MHEDEEDFWANLSSWNKPSYTGETERPTLRLVHSDEDEPQDDEPANIWNRNAPPEFPHDLLPPIIERFALIRAKMIGADPGGVAMSAIVACAAIITDRIRVKVKRHEDWSESARLWCMLIGDPSYKKSPVMRSATRKLASMDSALVRQYGRDMASWKEMGENGPAPMAKRLRIEDTTMEAAQEVCVNSPDGVLALQDELSGWFGGIEKYSGGKGGAKDRSFWLQAYGGGECSVNRVGRKSILIDNLSVSIIGGIQPDAIRNIMATATDDGLIQRFIPIVLRPADIGVDEEMPDVAFEYDNLIERLSMIEPPDSVTGERPLVFDEGAMKIRSDLERKHHNMVVSTERINKKFASHMGKYDGLFPRLCVTWHCIENAYEPDLPLVITEDTAQRVATFLHDYIHKQGMAFYSGIVGLSEDQDIIEDICGYVLAHELQMITMRTLQRGSRKMRRLTRDEGSKIFEQLEALGWVEQLHKRNDAPSWKVNSRVHTIFSERGESEKASRSEMMSYIKENLRKS